MDKNKYLYVSFLDLFSKSGGGHIETFSEISEFNKLFGEVDIICVGKNNRKNNLKLNNKISFVRPFCKFLPIFGKRPTFNSEILNNYKGVIIADSRCFISFLIALFAKKIFILNLMDHWQLTFILILLQIFTYIGGNH